MMFAQLSRPAALAALAVTATAKPLAAQFTALEAIAKSITFVQFQLKGGLDRPNPDRVEQEKRGVTGFGFEVGYTLSARPSRCTPDLVRRADTLRPRWFEDRVTCGKSRRSAATRLPARQGHCQGNLWRAGLDRAQVGSVVPCAQLCGARELAPARVPGTPDGAVLRGREQVAPRAEVVAESAECREKPLGGRERLEAAHLPLA